MRAFLFYSFEPNLFSSRYILVQDVTSEEQAWEALSKEAHRPCADLKVVCNIQLELDLPYSGRITMLEARPAS